MSQKLELDQRRDAMADVQKAILAVFNKYSSRPPYVVDGIVATLGYIISVTAQDPEAVLNHYGAVLAATDWRAARNIQVLGERKMEVFLSGRDPSKSPEDGPRTLGRDQSVVPLFAPDRPT